MTGHMQDLKFLPEYLALVFFLEKEIGLDRLDLEPESEVSKEAGIGDHRSRIRMTRNLAVESLFDLRQVQNMIDVAVREQQKFGFNSALP